MQHYATSEPMTFKGDGGNITPIACAMLSEPTRALRMGYDFARGAANVEEPVLLAVSPTIGDPSQAPPGKHTIKIIGMQPYDLKEGPQHWDNIKHQVADANLNWLRKFSPNLTDDKILARVVESPLDLERRESAQLARLLPRRRAERRAGGGLAAGAGLGATSHADRGPLSDRFHHASRRLDLRRAGA